jgi:hypothetical protein
MFSSSMPRIAALAPVPFLHRAGSRAFVAALLQALPPAATPAPVGYSASFILASSIDRIGASLGSIASSIFQRRAAAGLSPFAKSAAPR